MMSPVTRRNSTHYHCFMFRIDFSWVYQMKLGFFRMLWAVKWRPQGLNETPRKLSEIYTSNKGKINLRLLNFKVHSFCFHLRGEILGKQSTGSLHLRICKTRSLISRSGKSEKDMDKTRNTLEDNNTWRTI